MSIASIYGKEGQLNKEVLRDLLETYYETTGLNVFAIDEEGQISHSFGESADFCSFFQELTQEKCHCGEVHLLASKQGEGLGEAYTYYCPVGFAYISTPLVYYQTFKGAILAGPLLLGPIEDFWGQCLSRKYDLEEVQQELLLEKLLKVPVVAPKKMNFYSKLLFMITVGALPADREVLRERRLRNQQQARISESIHSLKDKGSKPDFYPYEKEKELLFRAKSGDLLGAKTILNDILGHIFFTAGGNMEIIKARTLELCALLSRAAVEGGAALDKIFGLNYSFISELSKIDRIEELSFWILKVLDRFSENLFDQGESRKTSEIMKSALKFMQSNYMNPLSLEQVAGLVHLHPSYFSTLFKKETGLGFTSYLNKIRIERSKTLLQDTRLSILDVALALGFEDQSYYTKVFKKFTGMTPKRYRDDYSYRIWW